MIVLAEEPFEIIYANKIMEGTSLEKIEKMFTKHKPYAKSFYMKGKFHEKQLEIVE